MILKVDKGYVNDDFLHDRITLKVLLDSGEYMPCKLYNDGRLVSFAGGFIPNNDDYEEREITSDLAQEIKAML